MTKLYKHNANRSHICSTNHAGGLNAFEIYVVSSDCGAIQSQIQISILAWSWSFNW